jgi:hypothetical protein
VITDTEVEAMAAPTNTDTTGVITIGTSDTIDIMNVIIIGILGTIIICAILNLKDTIIIEDLTTGNTD